MFPFQSGELSFQISNNNVEGNTNNNIDTFPTLITHQHLLLQPHLVPDTCINNTIKTPKPRKGRPKSGVCNDNNGNNHTTDNVIGVDNNSKKKKGENGGNDVAKKKVIHREVERQRRQEMSDLHSSLRNLLPMEYVKGKRSICDHVTEATRYIQDLEKSIKALGEKRDKLKESSCSSFKNTTNKRDFVASSSSDTTATPTPPPPPPPPTTTTTTTTTSNSEYNVSIQKFSRTIQVEIAAGTAEEDPCPLSRALGVMGDEGLDVVSCVSSKVNQRWIHVIYCEANDVTTVDSSDLQEKLMMSVLAS